jgi:hypothetical protein
MAIMSNPPPKGIIGRAVKPLAWHRSERASTDPAITAALTRFGTESGPPGIGAGRLRNATGTLDVRVPTKPFSIGHEVGRKWTSAIKLVGSNNGVSSYFPMTNPVNAAIYAFGGFMLFALAIGFLAAPVW